MLDADETPKPSHNGNKTPEKNEEVKDQCGEEISKFSKENGSKTFPLGKKLPIDEITIDDPPEICIPNLMTKDSDTDSLRGDCDPDPEPEYNDACPEAVNADVKSELESCQREPASEDFIDPPGPESIHDVCDNDPELEVCESDVKLKDCEEDIAPEDCDEDPIPENCNENFAALVIPADLVYESSVIENEATTCSSGCLGNISMESPKDVYINHTNDSVGGDNINPRHDATEIISSCNEDLESTATKQCREIDERENVNAGNRDDSRQAQTCNSVDLIGETDVNPDCRLLDPTDAGATTCDQNLTTTWESLFDDVAVNSSAHPYSNHISNKDELQVDGKSSATSFYENFTMSNNSKIDEGRIELGNNDDENDLPNGVSSNHDNQVINADSQASRNSDAKPIGHTSVSDMSQNKDTQEDTSGLSSATSNDSHCTVNLNPEADSHSDNSSDIEAIIGDVEAAQFDFGSVVPRCQGTVMSPKERTEEDAQALLKQIINGEPDPCLAPEVVSTYAKTGVKVVELNEQGQNVSLHNATNDNFCTVNQGSPGLLHQHLKNEIIGTKMILVNEQSGREEKNENGRFPFGKNKEDQTLRNEVSETTWNLNKHCIGNISKGGRSPERTSSYIRVSDKTKFDDVNKGESWFQKGEDLNEVSDSRLAQYEKCHVIYHPVRTCSFVVSDTRQVGDGNALDANEDDNRSSKSCGGLASPTQRQPHINGDYLPYVSPEARRPMDGMSITKSPHPSPIINLIGSICPSNSEIDSVDGFRSTNRSVSHANRMDGIKSLLGPTSCLYKLQMEEYRSGNSSPRKQCNQGFPSHITEGRISKQSGCTTLRRNLNEYLGNKMKVSSEKQRNRLLPDINKFRVTRSDRSPQKPQTQQRIRKSSLTMTRGSSGSQPTQIQKRDKGETYSKHNSSSHNSLIKRKAADKHVASPKYCQRSIVEISKKKVPPIASSRNRSATEQTNPDSNSNKVKIEDVTSGVKVTNQVSISPEMVSTSSDTLSSSLLETDLQKTKPARARTAKIKKGENRPRRMVNIEPGWNESFDKGNGPYFGDFVPSCLLYTPKKHLNPKNTSTEEYHKYKMDLRLSQSLARIKRGPPTVDCYLDPRFKPKPERNRSRSQKRHPSSHVVQTETLDGSAGSLNKNKNSAKQLPVT